MRIPLFLFMTLWAVVLSTPARAIEKQRPSKALTFPEFIKRVPQKLSKPQIESLFGKPTEIVDFKKLPDSKDTGESWKYDRFIFFFEDGSDITTGWTWDVESGDPEQNIKTAMSRYAATRWVPETVKWINPHAFPNECYFVDKAKGVSLEYNMTRKEVFSIRAWDPARKLASAGKDEKRPVYCIENACSPAYSAEEFFKGSSVEKYCELPK